MDTDNEDDLLKIEGLMKEVELNDKEVEIITDEKGEKKEVPGCKVTLDKIIELRRLIIEGKELSVTTPVRNEGESDEELTQRYQGLLEGVKAKLEVYQKPEEAGKVAGIAKG